ncbi:hypothetical protein [Azospirillum sp.]|uniref:hypothetical protein n=1 Tax=Azospirillum sp. TaxID=34012 RepID=UPI002D346754|nr:hypothetical protein [Azospirillum sp.]HYD66493.1 hypothetical protein [Azospirillum sp.]
MFNPLITATAGWSEAVEERAKRFLGFVVGTEGDGVPVTAATMLARCHLDPIAGARYLMLIPPQKAVRELTLILTDFRIDGQPCPDPLAAAQAALSFAGRAVTVDEMHPERRWVANLVASLLGLPRASR